MLSGQNMLIALDLKAEGRRAWEVKFKDDRIAGKGALTAESVYLSTDQALKKFDLQTGKIISEWNWPGAEPGQISPQSPAPRMFSGRRAGHCLILDNIPHIKAYWPMIGLETTATALSWGADDLDGTLVEEKIAHATGCQTPASLTSMQMEETISLGGFIPVERNGRFLPKQRETVCSTL